VGNRIVACTAPPRRVSCFENPTPVGIWGPRGSNGSFVLKVKAVAIGDMLAARAAQAFAE
jgi:hypothetical protein